MQPDEVRGQWEDAAPGWARWEAAIAAWMEPATQAMLAMAGVASGARVLDVACGAGSQTLQAARMVGVRGEVVATDIAESMLRHVRESASAAGLTNIRTWEGAAEDLDIARGSFDAAICRLGLMLFAAPAKALAAMRQALRPGGKVAVVVFGTPAANPFMAQPMQILLRHAGKPPATPGQPGIFALGSPGVLERLLVESGFVDVEQRAITASLRLPSAELALALMQEAFGAYRAVVSDSPQAVREAAWAEVGRALKSFETPAAFVAPGEVLVAAGTKPA